MGTSEYISKIFLLLGSFFKDISKYLSLENSLLAEIFINFPFSILPISLKLLIGISDFVTRFSKLISISLVKFTKGLFLLLELIDFSKFVASNLEPPIIILSLIFILKLLFSFFSLKVITNILARFLISSLSLIYNPLISIELDPS